jgi:hypothetical protein
MSKQNYQKPSQETLDEAIRVARGIQRPSQAKEQATRIAQSIQKGIGLYKRQQKSRARESDKKLKKASDQPEFVESGNSQIQERELCQQYGLSWLLLVFRVSWLLLVLTWLGIGIYLLA